MSLCAILLEGFQGIPRQTDGWMSLKSLLLLMAGMALLAALTGAWRMSVAGFFKDLLSPTQWRRPAGQLSSVSRFNVLLTVLSFVACSLFLALWLVRSGVVVNLRALTWKSIGLASAAAAVLLLSKHLILYIFSLIHFPDEPSVCGRLSTMQQQGLFFPVALLLAVNELFGLSGTVMLVSFFVGWLLTAMWKTFRLYSFFFSKGVSVVKFILYLCALEILPVCIFCKVVFPEW